MVGFFGDYLHSIYEVNGITRFLGSGLGTWIRLLGWRCITGGVARGRY